MADLQIGTGRPFEQGEMFQVVVSEHEEDAFVEAGRYKAQVLHGKIPGAQDNIRTGKSCANSRAVDQGVNVVGDAQYPHASRFGLLQQHL